MYFKTPGLDSRLGRVCKIPGEILSHEFMKPLGLSGNALARALRVPANRITGIIKGQRAVTTDTALRLARYFGTDAQSWLNLQSMYELRVAEVKFGKNIKRTVKPRAA